MDTEYVSNWQYVMKTPSCAPATFFLSFVPLSFFLLRILIRTSRALTSTYVTHGAYIPICVSPSNECVEFANVQRARECFSSRTRSTDNGEKRFSRDALTRVVEHVRTSLTLKFINSHAMAQGYNVQLYSPKRQEYLLNIKILSNLSCERFF